MQIRECLEAIGSNPQGIWSMEEKKVIEGDLHESLVSAQEKVWESTETLVGTSLHEGVRVRIKGT